MGSPPRARGKGFLVDGIQGRLGITPACAGKSFQMYRMPL